MDQNEKDELFAKLKKLIHIPEGIDPATVQGALRLMEYHSKSFRYAQNGAQYQLRWSSGHPPFPVPETHLPIRIAQRLLELHEAGMMQVSPAPKEPEYPIGLNIQESYPDIEVPYTAAQVSKAKFVLYDPDGEEVKSFRTEEALQEHLDNLLTLVDPGEDDAVNTA